MKKGLIGLLLASVSMVCLTGCFKAKYYNVNFYEDVNNTLIETQSVKKGQKFSYPTNIPNIKGYTFSSWSEQIQKVKSDMNVYARYTANQYTLILNYNISGKSSKSQLINYKQSLTLETPTYEGHTFNGWYDNSGKAYRSGSKYDVAENLTLYARWDLVNYTVSYDLDGGSLPTGRQNPTTVTCEDNITLENPTKIGYEFLGWYKESSFQNKITSLQNITSNLTLYAKYQIIYYDVNFYVGSQKIDSDKYTYGQKIKVDTTYDYDPDKEFKGWSLDGEIIDLTTYTVSDSIDLYATYYKNYIYCNFQNDGVHNVLTFGAKNASIIGLEIEITFDCLVSSIDNSVVLDGVVYNVVGNKLCLNAMYEENKTNNFEFFEFKTAYSSPDLFDEVTSYVITCYEKVDGQIQEVVRDFFLRQL